MFGFGYALVPLYKHICDGTGINILALGESRCRGTSRGGQQPGRLQPHHHGGVRRQRARPVGLQAGAGLLQVHPGELATVMYEFQNVQDRTMAAQAIPSYAPRRPPRTSTSWSASASTSTRWSRAKEAVAGGVRHRPEAAEGREDHHAVLYLLRGGRQGAGSAGMSL
jgi:hypothetical protein